MIRTYIMNSLCKGDKVSIFAFGKENVGEIHNIESDFVELKTGERGFLMIYYKSIKEVNQ